MAKRNVKKSNAQAANGSAKKKKSKKGPAKTKVSRLQKQVKIDRIFPEGQRAIYSNNFAVRHEEATCQMMFFEVNAPLFLGDDEEVAKEFNAVNKVEAECVARIVLPITIVPDIIKTLAESFQKHQAIASQKK